jgi:hypothetical protein
VLRKVGRLSAGKKAIMHPMFVQLYLETDASEDEQDERRRANPARRLRSRAAARVIVRERDRQPPR